MNTSLDSTRHADTLDVLFLLYENVEDQIHNLNTLFVTRYLRNAAIRVTDWTMDEVSQAIVDFLSKDKDNDKLILYVGHLHNGYFSSLQCGHESRLSPCLLGELVNKHWGTQSSLNCPCNNHGKLYIFVFGCAMDLVGGLNVQKNIMQSVADGYWSIRLDCYDEENEVRQFFPHHCVDVNWKATRSLLLREDLLHYKEIESMMETYPRIRLFD